MFTFILLASCVIAYSKNHGLKLHKQSNEASVIAGGQFEPIYTKLHINGQEVHNSAVHGNQRGDQHRVEHHNNGSRTEHHTSVQEHPNGVLQLTHQIEHHGPAAPAPNVAAQEKVPAQQRLNAQKKEVQQEGVPFEQNRNAQFDSERAERVAPKRALEAQIAAEPVAPKTPVASSPATGGAAAGDKATLKVHVGVNVNGNSAAVPAPPVDPNAHHVQVHVNGPKDNRDGTTTTTVTVKVNPAKHAGASSPSKTEVKVSIPAKGPPSVTSPSSPSVTTGDETPSDAAEEVTAEQIAHVTAELQNDLKMLDTQRRSSSADPDGGKITQDADGEQQPLYGENAGLPVDDEFDGGVGQGPDGALDDFDALYPDGGGADAAADALDAAGDDGRLDNEVDARAAASPSSFLDIGEVPEGTESAEEKAIRPRTSRES